MNATEANRMHQAAHKDRQRALGLTQSTLWVHTEDKERLKKYAAKLRKARGLS